MKLPLDIILPFLMTSPVTAAVSTFFCNLGFDSYCPDVMDEAVVSKFYFSVLNSAQNEHTTCDLAARGSAVASLTNTTFCIRLSYSGLSVPVELFSHIHGPADLGASAPVLYTLPITTSKRACFTFNSKEIEFLNDGLLYFNIHSNTTGCTAGELRGQILHSA